MTTPPEGAAPATEAHSPTAETVTATPAVQHHLHFTLTFVESGRITGGLADIAVSTMESYATAALTALLPRFSNSRWSLATRREMQP